MMSWRSSSAFLVGLVIRGAAVARVRLTRPIEGEPLAAIEDAGT
jgi:hypothetical protein